MNIVRFMFISFLTNCEENYYISGSSLGVSIHGCHLLKVSKFHGCQATVNQKFLKNSRVPLHRNSKYHGCQAPVAPVLKRALHPTGLLYPRKARTLRTPASNPPANRGQHPLHQLHLITTVRPSQFHYSN